MNQKSLDKKKTKELKVNGHIELDYGDGMVIEDTAYDSRKTKELDWEKEFDKNWINPWNRNNFGIPKAHLDIKDFISRTLTQQRTELLDEILGLEGFKKQKVIYSEGGGFEHTGYRENYCRNELRKQIKKAITNLLNKKDE